MFQPSVHFLPRGSQRIRHLWARTRPKHACSTKHVKRGWSRAQDERGSVLWMSWRKTRINPQSQLSAGMRLPWRSFRLLRVITCCDATQNHCLIRICLVQTYQQQDACILACVCKLHNITAQEADQHDRKRFCPSKLLPCALCRVAAQERVCAWLPHDRTRMAQSAMLGTLPPSNPLEAPSNTLWPREDNAERAGTRSCACHWAVLPMPRFVAQEGDVSTLEDC